MLLYNLRNLKDKTIGPVRMPSEKTHRSPLLPSFDAQSLDEFALFDVLDVDVPPFTSDGCETAAPTLDTTADIMPLPSSSTATAGRLAVLEETRGDSTCVPARHNYARRTSAWLVKALLLFGLCAWTAVVAPPPSGDCDDEVCTDAAVVGCAAVAA